MGYYIETDVSDSHFGKAEKIVKAHNGRIVTQEEASKLVDSHGVICVVRNDLFEAAAFAYNQDEFDAFTSPSDTRPKTFVVLDREVAKKLSGYKERD